MKKRKEYMSGRKHKPSILVKTVDGIDIIHWPSNNTVRYVASYKNPRIDVIFQDARHEQKAIDKVKEQLHDMIMKKLKTPPMNGPRFEKVNMWISPAGTGFGVINVIGPNV